MNFTIAVDVDGVVAALHAEWVRRYNEAFDDTFTLERWTTWDIASLVKPECGARYFDILRHDDLYDHVEPMLHALEGVEALREAGHRVVFCTATGVHQAGKKLLWLERHGFLDLVHDGSKDYVEMRDKSLIRADVLIDDYTGNLRGFHGVGVLFYAPWNRDHLPHHFWVLDWHELVANLQEIEEFARARRAGNA